MAVAERVVLPFNERKSMMRQNDCRVSTSSRYALSTTRAIILICLNFYRDAPIQSRTNIDFGKLLLCVAIDVIGSASELVPVLGELTDVVWAPIAGLALRSLYGSNVLFALEFAEEILPFTDIIPLATLW